MTGVALKGSVPTGSVESALDGDDVQRLKKLKAWVLKCCEHPDQSHEADKDELGIHLATTLRKLKRTRIIYGVRDSFDVSLAHLHDHGTLLVSDANSLATFRLESDVKTRLRDFVMNITPEELTLIENFNIYASMLGDDDFFRIFKRVRSGGDFEDEREVDLVMIEFRHMARYYSHLGENLKVLEGFRKKLHGALKGVASKWGETAALWLDRRRRHWKEPREGDEGERPDWQLLGFTHTNLPDIAADIDRVISAHEAGKPLPQIGPRNSEESHYGVGPQYP